MNGEPVPPLFDRAALRRIEQRTVDALTGDAFELMRRAGRAAWRCALRHWSQAQRIVVVCGPGNNGGDGYVLARYALDSGRDVRIVRLSGHAPRTAVAQHALEECRSRGARIDEFAVDGEQLPPADLLVDALFGIGLERAPEGAVAGLVSAINRHPAPCLALDVPSGVDSDRGSAPGVAVHATRTLEFIAAKAGLRTGQALDLCGELELAALDVPAEMFADIDTAAELLVPAQLARWLRPRPRNAHKGNFGRVLCVGGDSGAGGAIMLCAEAALRCGAGLVEVGTRPAHVAALLARCPEAMGHAVERVADVANLLERADVVALGPGLGQEQWGWISHSTLLRSDRPLVLDADALNLLARHPRTLASGTILTPHPGEAARLLDTSVAAVQADRFATARALCQRFACTVVLKGAGTLVLAPQGKPRLIDAGNAGMATGGMGDLLTGVIAALRAQGLSAFDAASAGALLHAAAGDKAAEQDGQRGLLPSDLLPWLHRLANPDGADRR